MIILPVAVNVLNFDRHLSGQQMPLVPIAVYIAHQTFAIGMSLGKHRIHA